MQVVINIKAGDKMGRACSSGATRDHSAALLCYAEHMASVLGRAEVLEPASAVQSALWTRLPTP